MWSLECFCRRSVEYGPKQARTGHEQTGLRRQVETTDAEIDRLVYNLYGLTDDEIRIVEEATGR